MRDSVKRKEEEQEPRQVLGSYTEAWSSRVINTCLTEFQNGQEHIPAGFKMKGINMADRGDGTFIVGFVITKEGH